MPILAEASRTLAMAWFEKGGEAPLLLKSNQISGVHRHVPLDLVLVPIREGRKVTGLSIHAGLQDQRRAQRAAAGSAGAARAGWRALEAKFGFDPEGHTGKALTHRARFLAA